MAVCGVLLSSSESSFPTLSVPPAYEGVVTLAIGAVGANAAAVAVVNALPIPNLSASPSVVLTTTNTGGGGAGNLCAPEFFVVVAGTGANTTLTINCRNTGGANTAPVVVRWKLLAL